MSLENGFYAKPTIFAGHNKMRIFQEISGLVLSIPSFKTISRRSKKPSKLTTLQPYSLGAGVCRAMAQTPIAPDAESSVPVGAAFGGYKDPASAARPAR